MLSAGAKKISFHGIIGMTYLIQSTDNLTPGSWNTRTTVTADASGNFSFTDSESLPAKRFYRGVAP